MQKTTISFKSWRVLFSAILVLVLFITGRRTIRRSRRGTLSNPTENESVNNGGGAGDKIVIDFWAQNSRILPMPGSKMGRRVQQIPKRSRSEADDCSG